MAASNRILVAKHAFVFAQDGKEVSVRKGATVRVGHPILDGNAVHFESLQVDYDVEDKPRPLPPAPKVGEG